MLRRVYDNSSRDDDVFARIRKKNVAKTEFCETMSHYSSDIVCVLKRVHDDAFARIRKCENTTLREHEKKQKCRAKT